MKQRSSSAQPSLPIEYLAVLSGFVTDAQVAHCKQLQDAYRRRDPNKVPAIADLLVHKGYVSKEQLASLRGEQKRELNRQMIPGYELQERIAKGAMGVVYRAKQISLDRIVAIKVLSPRLAADASFIERFFSEARAAARLNHANIISAIDVGEVRTTTGTLFYFAMEYVDGPTLKDVLKRGGALDEKRVVAIMKQVAEALEHAHRLGIIHRDIKPDNIMLDENGQAKLCDLGLAKVTGSNGLTETGITLGTPNYISPEQAKGQHDIDGRADLYSLGATMYHALTGETPYSGNAGVVMTKHVTDPPPDPLKVCPDIAPRTAHIVRRLMAKDREERYQSAKEVVRDLELAKRTLEAPPVIMNPQQPSSQSNQAVPAHGAATPGAAPRSKHSPAARLPGKSNTAGNVPRRRSVRRRRR